MTENIQQAIEFEEGRSYVLHQKDCEPCSFRLMARTGSMLTFVLRQRDNSQELKGVCFIPKDENQEVFAFTWNGRRAFLTASDYIRGYRSIEELRNALER